MSPEPSMNERTDREGDPWPTARTSDGVLIVPGLAVIDYNRRATTVTDHAPSIDGGTYVVDDTRAKGYRLDGGNPWFHTANGGLFDGPRLESRAVALEDPHCFVCGRHTDHVGEHDGLVHAGLASYADDGNVLRTSNWDDATASEISEREYQALIAFLNDSTSKD